MVQYSYRHAYDLFGIEATYGTAVSCTKDIGFIQNTTATQKNNLEALGTLSTRLVQQIANGNFEGNLDVEFLFQHGRVFQLLAGTTPTHAQTTNDWAHTIVDASAALPVAEDAKSFSWEDGYNATADVVDKYDGVKIGSLTVSLDLGGRVTCKMSCPFATQEVQDSSASSAVISTIPVLPSYAGTVKAGTEGSEGALARVQSFEVTFEANLTPVMALGTRFAVQQAEGLFNIRYRYSMAFEDGAEHQRFMGGTAPLSGSLASHGVVFNANNAVTLGSGRREIEIQLRGCKHEEYSRPVSIGGFIIQEVTGQASQLYKLFTVDNISSANF